jgi:hypothetical protein
MKIVKGNKIEDLGPVFSPERGKEKRHLSCRAMEDLAEE